jgi:Holliday junction resolvase RusA-like endonuclease
MARLAGRLVRSLAFQVFGDPVPQGSKRAFVVKNRAVVVDDNKSTLRSWRSAVIDAARQELSPHEGPELGPVRITLMFFLRQPQRPKAGVPIVKPDIDKLARAVLDGMTDAGVFRDDSQVTTLTARKRYTTEAPCVRVFVDGDA